MIPEPATLLSVRLEQPQIFDFTNGLLKFPLGMPRPFASGVKDKEHELVERITVGLSVLMINAHQLFFGADFKGITGYFSGAPINIMDVYISRDRAIAFVLAFVVVTAFWLFMTYTRTGRAIRAVSQDETGALIVGIGLNGIMMLTMALSCALAGSQRINHSRPFGPRNSASMAAGSLSRFAHSFGSIRPMQRGLGVSQPPVWWGASRISAPIRAVILTFSMMLLS